MSRLEDSGGGAVKVREGTFRLGSVGEGCRFYRYGWRGLERLVLVVQDGEVLNALLREWWRHLSVVPLDLEYFPESSEPAVVTLALSREVALIWHRPNLDRTRELPRELAALITSERHPKVGFALDNDIWKLAASTNLLAHGWPKGLLDIQTLFRAVHNSGDAVSMVDVVNAVNPPSNRFAKMPHSGLWNRPQLTRDQVIYAAGDAFVTWEVLDALAPTLTRLAPYPKHSRQTEGCEAGAGLEESVGLAVEAAKRQRQEDAEWLAEHCPKLLLDVVGFLRASFGENERLPRISKLATYLCSSCPFIPELPVASRRTVADLVVQFLIAARWIRVRPSDVVSHDRSRATSRLTLNLRDPLLKFLQRN